MQLILPFVRHVMCVHDYLLHQHLRIEHTVILWNHPSHDSQDGGEKTDVEQDRPMRRYLKVCDEIGVQKSCESEYACE